MKNIIDRMFFTMPGKALEFYSVIDTALKQSPRSLRDLGFHRKDLSFVGQECPTSYFYHETGTLAVIKPFKIEENRPVVRIIGNDENSIERVISSLESITETKLKGAIPLI